MIAVHVAGLCESFKKVVAAFDQSDEMEEGGPWTRSVSCNSASACIFACG